MAKRKRKNWGGLRDGAGRPVKVRDGRLRTMVFMATDEEWQRFTAVLPSDTRERFVLLLGQVAGEEEGEEGGAGEGE